MNNKGIFPCKNCENRKVGCHSSCEKYNNAKAKHNEINQIKRRSQDIDGLMIDSIMRKAEKNRRKYGYRTKFRV